LLESFELCDLPLLEAGCSGGEGLGDCGDRDVLGACYFVDSLYVRGDVLAVEYPYLDPVVLGLAVHRLLVLGVDFGALGDRLGEAVGGQQVQAEVFAEWLKMLSL
jgi:hypothetical protein